MDDEPAENISGGERGGGTFAESAPGDGANRAEAVVDRLGERYWQKTYGGRDAFECLVRTILSQNTSDKASQPAHDALMERYDGADADLAVALADAEQDELADTISSAGLYNQKSATIIRLAGEIVDDYGSADGFDEYVKDGDPNGVRDALLDMKGVGPKTADCVLLFAGGRDGVFPVDTHVHRIARRMGLAPADADHEGVREAIESSVPPEKCGFGHTAMIQFGREYCTARKPACLDDPDACPLADRCDQVGVYPETGELVDPSDAYEAE
ncbi:endonuclease III domain-containing protein [Halocalculus aciditolerans]|uniref:Endonuclease III n=1 Tax=Halocalculus aciditolerans TaxID=1383812 RepID=A0A830FN29_9EURY|nr:endonuclease III [Halocalculus aciditolerans]GGL63158.1 endonuclease III [Halocalculus aciditolerans]